MTDNTTYEENPCWDDLPYFGDVVPDDYDDEDMHVPGTCDYCGAEPWRWPNGDPHVDPFGQKNRMSSVLGSDHWWRR